jgi:hypothetical protein
MTSTHNLSDKKTATMATEAKLTAPIKSVATYAPT